MKNILIFLFLINLNCLIGCENNVDKKPYMRDITLKKRYNLSKYAIAITYGIEDIKCKDNMSLLNKKNDDDILSYIYKKMEINETIHYGKHIRKYDIDIYGNSYNIYIITNYITKESTKYTVIKIDDGIIYWRDNVASEKDNINNIDWDKVNHIFSKIIMDDNCVINEEEIGYNLPEYIY